MGTSTLTVVHGVATGIYLLGEPEETEVPCA